eukprot:TRINITY_DN1896_c0_g1_i1.p2 TRINITY_DN1896_c0_g1~~TRINITY_DN1896_c0_g1_i1.p2  ORF type:complete len:557 (+),score=98.00 TRINITY_DN1896_c0_g1_i1:1737-3407(+)
MLQYVFGILALVVCCSCSYLDPINSVPYQGIVHVKEAKGVMFICRKSSIAMLGLGNLRMPVPVIVGALDAEECSMLAASKDYLYVADKSEMTVYDTLNINEPLKVGGMPIKKGTVDRVLISGTFAYIFTSAGKEHAVVVANIANPEDPVKVGSFPLKGKIINACTDGRTVFAVSDTSFIIALDATKAYDFVIRSIVPLPAVPTCITIFREFIYVGIGSEIRFYNVDNVKQLEEAAKIDVGSPVSDLVFTRGNVYAATAAGLTVIDVKDPRRPYESGFRHIASPAKSIEVFVDVAYIVTKDEKLVMIDVIPPLDIPTPVPTEVKFKLRYNKDDPAERAKATVIDTFPKIDLDAVEIDEKIQAWRDIEESMFMDIPEWLVGGTAYVTTQVIRQGLHIRFSCADEVCNAFVFLEHCLPCSTASNGGLPSILITDGWVPSSCGPRFRLAPKRAPHSTVIFRKQFKKGQISVLPPLTKDARFASFAIKVGRRICNEISEKEQCTSKYLLCDWDEAAGGCVPKIKRCPRRNTVPQLFLQTEALNCTKCAEMELSVEALRDVI